tara:strand:+ start:335477 stop:336517 length:1041 start_codon:yes stop_codon:yes gene_type:complete
MPLISNSSQWTLDSSEWLWLILAIPLMAMLIFLQRALLRNKRRFIRNESLLIALAGKERKTRNMIHMLISFVSMACITIAIARPQSDPREIEVETKGRDVVFLVDVSRSMLARDVAPNRLEKTKLWINDLVDELGNDRVGLVAFSGFSSVLSPLTTDRLFFKLALEELSPASTHIGGTNIGDAIRKTMDLVFEENQDSEQSKYRDIILISDGEDQESLPVEAARLAGSRGVRIITIGIGSDQGATVPWDKDSSTPQSQTVRSKLESGTLRTIAAASPGGVFLEVGTGTIDLGQVYRELIATADQRTLDVASHFEYTERFQIFLAIGVGLALIDALFLSVNRRRNTQ